jgi:hypothetical protein
MDRMKRVELVNDEFRRAKMNNSDVQITKHIPDAIKHDQSISPLI